MYSRNGCSIFIQLYVKTGAAHPESVLAALP